MSRHPVHFLRAHLDDQREQALRERQAEAISQRSALNVENALVELRVKDRNLIETEAAMIWASRAIASYTLAVRSPDRTAQVLRFSEGEDFAGEAREHASRVQDDGKVLAYVTREVANARGQALGVAVQS